VNNLGLTLERLGQVDAAMARFGRRASRPRNWSYHFTGARASQGHDWDRAIAGIEWPPGCCATSTRYLAMALHRKGDELGAVRVAKGIEMAPGVASFHHSASA
jgi:hypothetical protein